MVTRDQSDINIQLSERVAVLETNSVATTDKLESIEEKLDNLLELKAKGMGALGLVSLVVGSGILGLIAIIFNFFRGGATPHL